MSHTVPFALHPAARLGDRARRQAFERDGRWAEFKAELLLRLKGYSILARRFKTSFGEVDLVARRGRRLAFVEVKLRATADSALDAVGYDNRQRVYDAADLFQRRCLWSRDLEPSFDVVAVPRSGWPLHLRDAFPFE